MKPSVHAALPGFSKPLEGRVPFMYLDSREPRGLVTIGVGNLCPLAFAILLPFRSKVDGHVATRAEITAEWTKVESRQDLKDQGGVIYATITDLRIAPEAIDAMVERKLQETVTTLRGMFPAWDDWPADAQLFAISWAWAVGPHSPYPRMIAALRARDFESAADECTINPQRGTLILRNERNLVLLRNAARVDAIKLDPEELHWPKNLAALEQADIDTRPELDNPPSDPGEPTTLEEPPVLEDDGGASRREATSWAVNELAEKRDDDG